MRRETFIPYSQDRADANLAMQAEKEGFASVLEVEALMKRLRMDTTVS